MSENIDHKINLKWTAEQEEASEDDIDDPYEPLEHDKPGPLPERPFKLRMPTKKIFVKASLPHSAQFAHLASRKDCVKLPERL